MSSNGVDFSVLQSNVLTTSYIATDLVLGETYTFTVESRNSVGYSEQSDPVSIFHALVPEQPAAPTTTISGDNVVVTWLAPSENGSTISSYTIAFRESDGITFTEEVTNCDGVDSSIVFS